MTRLLKYAFALVILAVLVWRADPAELWHVLQDIDLTAAGLALLIDVPVCAAVTLRSGLVLGRLGHRVQPGVLLTTSVMGYVAGAITPAASGELLRAVSLRARAGVPIEEGVTLVVYERAGSLYLLGVATAVFAAIVSLPGLWGIAASIAGVTLVFLPWLIAVSVLPRLPEASRLTGAGLASRTLRYLLSTADRLRFLLADLALLTATSLMTLLLFALSALQYLLLTHSVGHALPFDEAFLAFGASQLAGILSLLPLGLGISDGSLAAILHKLDLSLEQSTAVAVLARGVVTLPLTLAGLACYVYLQRIAGEGIPASDEARVRPPPGSQS